MVLFNLSNIVSVDNLLPDHSKFLPDLILISPKFIWHSSEFDFKGYVQNIYHWNMFEFYMFIITAMPTKSNDLMATVAKKINPIAFPLQYVFYLVQS